VIQFLILYKYLEKKDKKGKRKGKSGALELSLVYTNLPVHGAGAECRVCPSV